MLYATSYHLKVPVSIGLSCSLCLYNLALGTYHTGKLGVKGLFLCGRFTVKATTCVSHFPTVSGVEFTLLKHMPLCVCVFSRML